MEVHTELISAETRLMLVLLEVMRVHQSVSAFLKRSSDNIKYCANSFKSVNSFSPSCFLPTADCLS